MTQDGKLQLLTRDDGLVVKALCIMMIVMHNYLHLRGYAAENEFQFFADRVAALASYIQAPSLELPLHIISFVVSYAVVGFVFISGYGLVKKYEQSTQKFRRWPFVVSHYLKLLRLLALALLVACLSFYFMRGKFPLSLSEFFAEFFLLGNLQYQNISIYPFVYWYLGMALQLYLLYALLLHRRQGQYTWWHQLLLAALVTGCGVAQMCCEPTGYNLYFMRINLIGYVGPFVAGIVTARHLDHITLKPWQWWLVVLISGTVTALSLTNYYSWLWGWIPTLVFIVSVVKACRWLRWRPVLWLGSVSAMVYVCHPIVREWVIGYMPHHIKLGLVIYLVLSVVLAAGYAWLLKRLPSFQKRPSGARLEFPS